MKRIGWLLSLTLVLVGAFWSPASAQLSWDPKEMMGIGEINPGMTGYGKTVYNGTKVETFDVEVIGILKKIDFGFDMILIRVTSGPLVERKLQTVSGMSGSPIYINDRLIGAYAFGWDFQQEPIAGVTPIAAMLECTQPGSVTPPLVGSLAPKNKVLTIGDKLITNIKVAPTLDEAKTLQAKADPTTMVLSPVATPLFVNGMPDNALPTLQRLLSRYNVRALAGPGAMGSADAEENTSLEAGSAVAASLIEGDVNMSAVGTVTYVKGDQVLAFGHPFFGLGSVDIPMAPAYVHGIINSSSSSFKLASPLARCGSVTSDRTFAIGGVIGKQPATFPVYLNLTDTSRNFTRRYAIDMMHDADFSPYLLYMFVLYNGASQMGDLFWDEGTFSARAVISTDEFGDIEQRMVVSPQAGSSFLPMGEFYLLADSLMLNPYEPVKLKRAFIDLKYTPERNIATIEKVTPDRLVARPGETVNLTVKIRPYGKPVETRMVSVKVPEQTTESAMAIVVAGGAMGQMLKPLTTPMPATEEGVKGMVRWLTDIPSSQSIITAQLLPSPSYPYHGRVLRDVPAPLLDLLQFADFGGGLRPGAVARNGNEDGENQQAPGEGLRPTAYMTTTNVPYTLTGGQVAMIAIETEDQLIQSNQSDFNFGMELPVLSSSVTPGQAAGSGNEGSKDEAAYWFTPQQRARHTMMTEGMKLVGQQKTTLALPQFRTPGVAALSPLSVAIASPRDAGPERGKDVDVEATPADDDEAAAEDDASEDDASASASTADADKVLLSHRRYSWGLSGRKDFLRGKHLGTGVTSKGALVLAPAVSALYQSTDLVAWKMVSTAQGTFLAGWNSNQVIRIAADGKAETFFPQQPADAGTAEAVTALAVDRSGNLLIATWPDQRVRLVKPNGVVERIWSLPGTAIWDLAVTTTGKRYAACDEGALYLLRDDQDNALQVGCTVPDKHIYALAAGPNGDLYLGTFPRGKVYCLSADNSLTSVYEAHGAVTSLAVDAKRNLYVGVAPSCQVVRVSPDGTTQVVLRGMGRGNRHVLALQVVGDDLYAATGPAGGIYRVTKPTSQDPEASVIFARADQRNGGDENGATGAESVMVNALAVSPAGNVLAATSSPTQVLQLTPRTEGAFLSTVLQTPTVARWGQLDVHFTRNEGQSVVVETRSGQTAVPDKTWSAWAPISKDGNELTSAPATFAQFRVSMKGQPTASPSLEYARLFYQPMNQAPQVKLDTPKPGQFVSKMLDIRWEARDPDEDEMVYTVYTSRDDGRTWTQLRRGGAPVDAKPAEGAATKSTAADAPKDAPASNPAKSTNDSEVTAKTIPWDSTSVPDGAFRVKVVASDKYAKPTDPKSGEVISGRFIVDNTAPTATLEEKIFGWDKVSSFDVTDNLTPIIGGKFRLDDGPWIALIAADGIFNSKQETVKLISPDGSIDLPAGEHKLAIQLKDSADNLLDKTYTVVIGQKPPQPVENVKVPPVGETESKDLAELMLYNLK